MYELLIVPFYIILIWTPSWRIYFWKTIGTSLKWKTSRTFQKSLKHPIFANKCANICVAKTALIMPLKCREDCRGVDVLMGSMQYQTSTPSWTGARRHPATIESASAGGQCETIDRHPLSFVIMMPHPSLSAVSGLSARDIAWKAYCDNLFLRLPMHDESLKQISLLQIRMHTTKLKLIKSLSPYQCYIINFLFFFLQQI